MHRSHSHDPSPPYEMNVNITRPGRSYMRIEGKNNHGNEPELREGTAVEQHHDGKGHSPEHTISRPSRHKQQRYGGRALETGFSKVRLNRSSPHGFASLRCGIHLRAFLHRRLNLDIRTLYFREQPC